MSKTEYWKNRKEGSPRNYDKKRDIINRINDSHVQDFFKKYEDIYFPDISTMTPLEKIDNVLKQQYSLNMEKYSMGVENYGDFIEALGFEGYSLINQAEALIKETVEKKDDKNTEKETVITIKDVAKNALEKTNLEKAKEAESIEKNNSIDIENNKDNREENRR